MTEQIFEFKTVGVGDILAAYRQIEAAQKAFEEASKRSVGSLSRESVTIRELAKANQELAQSNLSVLNVAKSSQAEIAKQIAAEIRLTNQIKSTNAAYRDRNTAASSGQSQFSETIGKSLEESITKSIEKGFQNAKKGNISGLIGNVLSAPFKAAGSAVSGAVSSIGLGLVQSITAPIGANFGKGLSNALEQSLSKSVGSSELFAEKVGGAIGSSITSGISSRLEGLPKLLDQQIQRINDKELRRKVEDIVAQVKEIPQAVTETLGGQDAIAREGLVQRGSRQRQKDAEVPIAREQAAREFRDQLNANAELDTNKSAVLDQQINQVAKQFERSRKAVAKVNQLIEKNFGVSAKNFNIDLAPLLNQRKQAELESSVVESETKRVESTLASDQGKLPKLQEQLKRAESQKDQIAVEELSEKISDTQTRIEVFQKSLLTLAARGKVEAEKLKQIDDQIATQFNKPVEETLRFANKLEALQNRAVGAGSQLQSLKSQKQESDTATQSALEQSRQKRETLDAVSPERQPKAYEDLARTVLKARFDSDKLPELVVADDYLKKQNAESLYSTARNRILVTEEILKAVKDGTLTEQQVKILAEEIAHADDFDFGSAKGIEARKKNRVTTTPVVPTTEELQQLAPELGRYAPEQRPLELNAKVRALRATEEFQQQQAQEKGFTQITDAARLGETLPQRRKAFDKLIEDLKASAEKLGVDVSKEIENYTQQFNNASEYVEKIAQRALENVDLQNPKVPDLLGRSKENAIDKLNDINRGVFQTQIDLPKQSLSGKLESISDEAAQARARAERLAALVEQNPSEANDRFKKILAGASQKADVLSALSSSNQETLKNATTDNLDEELTKVSTNFSLLRIKANELAQTLDAVEREIAPQKQAQPLQIPLKLEKQRELEPVEVAPRQEVQKLALRQEQEQPGFREQVTNIAEGAGRAALSTIEGFQKAANVVGQVADTLQAPATVVAKGFVEAGKGIFEVAKTGYKVAEALESFALDIVPAGRGIKAVGKNVALPALAFGAASTFIPGAAPAIGAATQIASSALAPLGTAASASAGSAIGGLLPNVLGLQGTVAGAVTGGLDLAFAGASVILAKTGVAVVGGRTVATLAGRTARVVTDVVNNAIDGATEQVGKAKVKRAERKARAKEKGAIDVTVAPVAEEAPKPVPKPKAPAPSAVQPKATQQQIDAAIAEAQNLDKQFASAYQSLKEAIKAGDTRLVRGYQETIQNLAVRAKTDIDGLLAELKAAGDKSGAISKLGGVKGRLSQKESLVAKEIAKFEKAQQARGEDLSAQSLDVTLGFGGVDKGLESLKRAAAKTADALNGAIAAFAEIDKQATLAATAKQAARTPKVQAVAKDLAVNTAGFVASKVASSQGDVAGLAGDAIGALAARQAINAATPFVQAYLELKKTLEFREATNKEKVQQIIALVKQYRVSEQQQSEELFGDVVGFGVGNTAATLANSGLDALSDTVPAAKVLRAIPFKGAAVAMTAVPQLAKLRERINEQIRPQQPDINAGEDLNAQSLNPNAILQNLSSRRKQLLEIVEQKIGNAIDELSLKLKNQPDLIDNAQVTRTLKRLNQVTERILDERSQLIDQVSEKQFQEFLAGQQAVLTRIQAKQARQPDLDAVIDRANREADAKAQRLAFEGERKGLTEVTRDFSLLRVEDEGSPAERESFVRSVKLFFGRLDAEIQEKVRNRLQRLLTESANLGNDLATSQTVQQGRGETTQAQRLGGLNSRLSAANKEARDILFKPRVEVTKKDLERLRELEDEIFRIYKAVNLPPPPGGGFLGEIGDSAGESVKKLGGGIGAAAVGLGAGQFASQALQSTARGAVDEFKTFADFDQQIRTFGVVSQSSEKQVAGVRAEIERLSRATVKTPQEISAAAVEFTKLGFDSEKTSAALEGIVQSSAASGESLSTTAQVIGVSLNAFQLPAKESVKVADLLTQASNASATGTAEIGESLKYVGGQAKDSNQSLEETVTVIALMSASGLKGSEAGTGLAEALKRIKTASALATTELDELKTKGSGPAVAAFKLLNEQVRGADGKLLPFTQILGKVKKGLEGFKQSDKDLILNALFGSQGSRAVLSVIGLSGEKIAETTSAMKDFQGASKKASDALTQGASGSIQQFTGSLELLKIKAGETAGVGFTPLLNAGTALINGFLNLDPNLQKALILFAGLGTTLAAATVAVIAFNIANESIVGTVARSTIALIADAGATAAKTVATNALTASQVLANTQITRAGIVTGVSTAATAIATTATSAWAAVTSGKLIPSLVQWATQAKVAGVASLTALAPLAAAAGAVAAVALVADTYASIRGGAEDATQGQEKINEALRQFNLEAKKTKPPETTPKSVETPDSKGIAEASKELNIFQQGLDAVRGGVGLTTAAQERYNNKVVEFSDLLTQSGSVIERVRQSQAELAALQQKITNGTATKEEQDQYNKKLEETRKLIDATTDAVKGAKAPNEVQEAGQKEQLSTLEKLKTQLTGNVKTTEEMAKAEEKEAAAKKKTIDEIKAKIELGELSQQQAISELEDVRDNSATEAKVRKEAADAIVKIRQDQINAEIAEIQAGQAEVEAALATGRISEADADKQTTQLKIDEINKRIEANQVALDAANDPAERQKLLAEERKLQTEITKTRAEEQKRRYERELKEVEKAYKKANDAIRQAETERLTELQILANKGAIRQEELEKEKANVTVQRTEDEYDAEVEKLNKLRSLPRLDDQAGREAQANAVAEQEQKIAEVTLKRLQVQEEAENRVRAIVIRNLKEQLAAQQRNTNTTVAGFEKQTAALDAITKSLERQNQLLQSRANLAKAVSDAGISSTNIELTNAQRALEIRQQLDSGQVKSDQERVALEQELNNLGFNTGQTALSILQQKQALEDQLAQQKRSALLAEQAQAVASLELELRRNDLAAKRAVIEAKIADVKAQQSVVDAQAALREAQILAQKSGDKTAVANAQQQLQLAQQSAQLSGQNVTDAQESAKAQSEIAANAKQALEVQQQAALKEFDAAEAARQNAQNLEFAKIQAEGLANQMERAANASDRINQNTGGGSLPGRKDGGAVESGQAYIVGEHSPEVFVPGATGVVLNRDQINSNLDTLFRASPGFNLEPQFNARVAAPQASSGGALNTLVAETRSLRATMERMEQRKPVMPVTANFNDGADSRDWDRFMKLQRSVLRSQI